jgi:hypothetical protein
METEHRIEPLRGSDILAYTPTYGRRPHLPLNVPVIRGSAGVWFDWLVCAGAPEPPLKAALEALLKQPDHQGIQFLKIWKQNRGQHHGTAYALNLARKMGYKWLLRLDDDVTPKTKRFLKKMVERLDELKALKGDNFYRLIAAPRIVGLNNPLQPSGIMNAGQTFPVEVMTVLGGACRLHPVELLEDYEPPLYDPKGRGDPESLARYLGGAGAFMVRFPDIRVVHRTVELEGADTEEEAHQRKMAKFWPWLGVEED